MRSLALKREQDSPTGVGLLVGYGTWDQADGASAIAQASASRNRRVRKSMKANANMPLS